MEKKKIFRRILVLTLVLCQFIGVLALTGCKKEQDSGTTDTTGQSENTGDTTGPSGNKNEELPVDVKELTIVEDGKTDYVIIRSQTAKQWEINAAVRFRDTIKALTGVEIPLKDDFEREGTEYQRTEKEILIGSTNREDAFDADYDSFNMGYRILADRYRLILLAGSPAGMDSALKRFFSDFYGIDLDAGTPGKAAVTNLYIDTSYTAKAVSVSAELPYLQIPLKDYTLIYKTDDYMQGRYAVNLAKAVKGITKANVPLAAEKSSEGKNLVLAEDSTLAGGKFRIAVTGTDITLYAADYYGFGAATDWLKQDYNKRLYFTFADGFSVEGNHKQFLNDLTTSTRYAYERAGMTRVMFNNVLWGNGSGTRADKNDIPAAERNRLTAQMVGQYMPDVLGLQEFNNSKRSGAGEYDLVALLSALGYEETLDPKVENSINTNCVPLFYRKETTTLVKSGYHWYENQPNISDGNDKASKSMTWGVFESKVDGSRYIVVSTHLCTQDDDIGALQAAEAVEIVRQLESEYNCPAIVGGDYNAPYSEKTYQYFVNTAGYRNAREVAENTTQARTSHPYPCYNKELGMIQPDGGASLSVESSIDHITLHNDNSITINAFGVVIDECTLSASDHFPIFIDFTAKDTADWTLRY